MWRILGFLWLGLLSLEASASQLEVLKHSGSRQAVVLVGGIGGSHLYFDPWLDELRRADASVHGFVHDHRAVTMTKGARALADELLRLADQGVESVTILAHSMGGLVAKKALHLLTPQQAARFMQVELRAYGTPWGGFFVANFARWIPGSRLVSRWIRYPMAAEIGSRSDFMLSLRQPLPSHMRLVVYEGVDDEVARPRGWSATWQYQSVVALAHEVHRLAHVRHDAFVKVLAFSL